MHLIHMTCIDYTAAVNDRLEPATIHPLGISPRIPQPLPMSHSHSTQRNSEMGVGMGVVGVPRASGWGPWNFP